MPDSTPNLTSTEESDLEVDGEGKASISALTKKVLNMERKNKARKDKRRTRSSTRNSKSEDREPKQGKSTPSLEEQTRSTSNSESSAAETSDDEATPRRTKKRTPPKSKKGVNDALKGYKKLLEQVVAKVGNEDVDMTTTLNELPTSVKDRPSRKSHTDLKKIRIRTIGQASPTEFTNAVNSLKNCFHSKVEGAGDDVVGLLKLAIQFTISNDLDRDQFYTLLKSRMKAGSPIYDETVHHEDQETPPNKFINEIMKVYCRRSTYPEVLKDYNDYEPSANEKPIDVLLKAKSLALKLGKHSRPSAQKDVTYGYLKAKLLNLYPHLAPQILEKEEELGKGNIAALGDYFLTVAPYIPRNRRNNRYPQVHEVNEGNLEEHTVNEIQEKKTSLKLTSQQLKELRGKCFKCGNRGSQAPHMGRDCKLYADTPLASYMCNKCHEGVHLPKYCKQSITNEKEDQVLHVSPSELDQDVLNDMTLESLLLQWAKNE